MILSLTDLKRYYIIIFMLYVIMSLYAKDTLLKVQEAIESLLNQTYTSFYLYIICDGPIENGVASYVTNLLTEQICINTREKNLGLAYSLMSC